MLTAEIIENQNYCTNDVADLLMKVQIASKALAFVADAIARASEGEDYDARMLSDAHGVAITTYGRINSDHSKSCCADVTADDKGGYNCACSLMASAE